MDHRATMPAVDERLVVPEQGYEIVGGEVFAVSPAKEPHARRHSRLIALLEAAVRPGWLVAADMLTRASAREDFAPDASVYPAARDPETGGRQLERLAFEVVVSETLAHAGRKAASLTARGVARVLALDVERARVLQWSTATGSWELLAPGGTLDDEVLALALPIAELVSIAATDDAVARALLAKRNAVLEEALAAEQRAGHALGLAEAIVTVLVARGIAPDAEQRRRILATTDTAVLARWLADVASCTSARALLGD